MRLVWSSERSAADDWATLQSRGFDPQQWGLRRDRYGARLKRRFPILISQSGRFVAEAFDFLFDVAFVRGSTRSERTLATYAESLQSWLTYAEQESLEWRRPSALMLAAYRDHLLGTDGNERYRSRPLARRTVNLRLTVATEFYKHLGLLLATPSRGRETRDHSRDERSGVQTRSQDFRRLRVRVHRRRPKALRAEHCRALCRELANPYRLMWQWALCTGLRTCSLIRIKLKAFEIGVGGHTAGQTMDFTAKGGKVVSIHVPAGLLDATCRYISVDRMLAVGNRRSSDDALFLNAAGRPVTAKGYYRAVKRASARLGIAARPHQARTTFATHVRDRLELMSTAGRQIDAVKVVQSLLAHADARTTEQYLESIDVPSLDVLQVLDELARTTDVQRA